jgi:hypothetical protein
VNLYYFLNGFHSAKYHRLKLNIVGFCDFSGPQKQTPPRINSGGAFFKQKIIIWNAVALNHHPLSNLSLARNGGHPAVKGERLYVSYLSNLAINSLIFG